MNFFTWLLHFFWTEYLLINNISSELILIVYFHMPFLLIGLHLSLLLSSNYACIDCVMSGNSPLLMISTPWFFISGVPTSTELVYNEIMRSLTCTSTGGPATNVTWKKNGAPITINSTYQQTKVVSNTTAGTYQTVLTIAQNVTDIFGTYSCTVGNTRGTSVAIEITGKDFS